MFQKPNADIEDIVMEDQKLTIELTVAQWNGILAILGQRQFTEVAGVIGEIKNQADWQLNVTTEPQQDPS
jgi:hypothetical protein